VHPESEKTLAGLAPRWLWVGLVRAFGKRGCSPSAFELLDFRPKLLDHSVLIQNDLNQLLAAEAIQWSKTQGAPFPPY
jgi:hypothetical protein